MAGDTSQTRFQNFNHPPTQEHKSSSTKFPILSINHQSAWETFCLNNPPLCSTISSIKEPNLRILIEHLLTFLTERLLSNPNPVETLCISSDEEAEHRYNRISMKKFWCWLKNWQLKKN
jgi:hypothetical protein